jgi:atypical dual specificity phosphatase
MNPDYYDAIACITDYYWGKSRYYLQPLWSVKYDGSRVTDNIYISDLATAFNKDRLKEEGITHVVNLVLGMDSIYPEDFKYLNIPLRDIANQDILKYLDTCVDFMHEAISLGGKVLVHCSYGVSRSASVIIAYLIKYKKLTYNEAYDFLKNQRGVIEPNPGFKKQLQIYSENILECDK